MTTPFAEAGTTPGVEVWRIENMSPVKIVDLARNMIELSGLTLRSAENPKGDIAIETIGLRPGEKLFEELLIGEAPLKTKHQRIMSSHEDFVPWFELEPELEILRKALADGDALAARSQLLAMVPEFQPTSPLIDWIASERRGRLENAPMAAPGSHGEQDSA